VDCRKAAAVLELVASGQTLSEACRQPNMPSRSTIYAWLDADQDFARRFERALERGGDAVADYAHHLAANTTKENAAANRIILDALKWRAARLNSRYAAPVSADTAADDIPSVDMAGARDRLMARFEEIADRLEAGERDHFASRLVNAALRKIEDEQALDVLLGEDRALIVATVVQAISPPGRSQNYEAETVTVGKSHGELFQALNVAEHNSVNGIGDVPSQNSEPHAGCAVPLDVEPLVSSIPAATVEAPAVPYPWDAWMRR
jgi:hypothetical protein